MFSKRGGEICRIGTTGDQARLLDRYLRPPEVLREPSLPHMFKTHSGVPKGLLPIARTHAGFTGTVFLTEGVAEIGLDEINGFLQPNSVVTADGAVMIAVATGLHGGGNQRRVSAAKYCDGLILKAFQRFKCLWRANRPIIDFGCRWVSDEVGLEACVPIDCLSKAPPRGWRRDCGRGRGLGR